LGSGLGGSGRELDSGLGPLDFLSTGQISPAYPFGLRRKFWGLDTDAIIDSTPNSLLRAQIALGRLNGNMPEQHLDLL
jgi:hypothetical protein